jgi:hypothetical protein
MPSWRAGQVTASSVQASCARTNRDRTAIEHDRMADEYDAATDERDRDAKCSTARPTS